MLLLGQLVGQPCSFNIDTDVDSVVSGTLRPKTFL